jgi:hypothetical protein
VTRIYAIVKRSALPELKDWFHYGLGHHWIDLGSTTSEHVLLIGFFEKESGELFVTSHPDVQVLPDPHFEGNSPLNPEHAALVAVLKPQGPTVLDIARAAGKIHPLMRLRSFG